MTAPDPIPVGLVRHFPTDWNAAGRMQGRTDRPLSDEGRAALARVRLPEGWRGLPVVASPLIRARETAAALAAGAPVAILDDLAEMDLGDWEGRLSDDLLADPGTAWRPVETWGRAFAAPGGESVAALEARVAAALAEAAARFGPCVAVTHRGVMRAAHARAAGWDWTGAEPFRIKRAALHPVHVGPDGPVGFDPWRRLEARA